MKRALFLAAAMAICDSTAQSQSWTDYIRSVRGDTVVVADYWDVDPLHLPPPPVGTPNTLICAVELDSVDNRVVPAGRVYELQAGGLYIQNRTLHTPWTRPLRIEGAQVGSIVKLTAQDELPLIASLADAGSPFNGNFFELRTNVTLKNLEAVPACSDGSQGWFFCGAGASCLTLTLDNVLMEHTRWVFFESNNYPGNNLVIKNSYFVNMSGQPCRRNGGVYDNVDCETDTLWVENTTHVMAQGPLYRMRNFEFKRVVFTHNTFVNCAGRVFETMGYQSNAWFTSNLFVNCNAQGYQPGEDESVSDADQLPEGIINVDTLLPSMAKTPAERRFVVAFNGAYWDPKLATIVTYLNDNHIIGSDDHVFRIWLSQTMPMNGRTEALFADKANYPHLFNMGWVLGAGAPDFANPADLLTTGVDMLVAFADSAASNDNQYAMPCWRTAGNPADVAHWIYPDWPIPVDLSYTTSAYLTGGFNGYPMGDLNWFPTQKASWEAQRAAEFAAFDGVGWPPWWSVEPIAGVKPASYVLDQNYPNPFNPTTKITYAIPGQEFVSLKVYNVLGAEVATLVSQVQEPGRYRVTFDGRGLASGVYYYCLEAGTHSLAQKMVLVK